MTKVRGYPHHQGFNVNPRRNLTKSRAWWQLGSTNNQRSSQKKTETVG